LTILIIECINMTSAVTNKTRPMTPVTATNLFIYNYYTTSVYDVKNNELKDRYEYQEWVSYKFY